MCARATGGPEVAEGFKVRGGRVVAALAACLLMVGGIAVPAEAAATVTATITLKTKHGALPAGCVTLKSTTKTVKNCAPKTGGVFSFSSLPVATYVVTTSGFAHYYTSTITLSSSHFSSGSAKATMTLKRHGLMAGTVKSTTNVPLAGAHVHLVANTVFGTPAATFEATTDASGHFEFYVSTAGYYKLSAGPVAGHGTFAGFGGYSDGFNVVADAVYDETISLEPSGNVTGMLVAPPTITSATVCASLHARGNGSLVDSACGAPGTPFSITNVNPGSYTVCLTAEAAPATCASGSHGTSEIVGADHLTDGSLTNPHAATITSGETTEYDVVWGGHLSVVIEQDNGVTVTDGCLRLANAARAVDVQDCDPVAGVFSFDVPSDLENGGLGTLIGSSSAADATFGVGSVVGGASNDFDTLPILSKGTASIEVHAHANGGAALTSGCLVLYVWRTSFSSTQRAKVCDLSQPVSFTGLAAGTYSVGVTGTQDSFASWWAPGASATLAASPRVALAEGDSQVLDLEPPLTQVISGTVKDADGSPMTDGTVEFVVNDAVVASASPAADGSYSITSPVQVGRLRLNGFGKTVTQWQPSVPRSALARTFGGPTAPATTTGADFVAKPDAYFTGPLQFPSKFTGTSGCIYAIPAVGITQTPLAEWCGTAADSFSLPVLAGSAYKLCIHAVATATPCAGADSGWEDLGGPDTTFVANPDGGQSPVDVSYGGTYRIVPRDDSAAAIPGGCAELTVDGAIAASSCDRVGGAFEFTLADDVKPSQRVAVALSGFDGYLETSAYLDSVAGGVTLQSSPQLPPWGQIKGTITRPAGFTDTTVCAYVTDLEDFEKESCAAPGGSSYAVSVPPGTYHIQFYSQEPGVAFEWYSNATVLHDASGVDIGNWSQVINATLAPSGTIAGSVVDPIGGPATGGCVAVVSVAGWMVDEACVDGDGAYSLGNLPAGAYRLKFVNFEGLGSEWSGGTNFGNAATYTVVAGKVQAVNAQLAPAAPLKGHVTYNGGAALDGCVDLIDGEGYTLSTACVDDNGDYSFSDAPSGSFHLEFRDFTGAANTWSGNATSFARSGVVAISIGTLTTYNISLGRGGSVSGTLPAGYPYGEWFDISLLDASGYVVAWQHVSVTTDDYVPLPYAFTNVPAGTYKIRVDQGTDLRAYYSASGSLAPTAVKVPSGTNWSLTGLKVAIPSSAYTAGFDGYLNVPSTWHATEVCAVALTTGGTFVSSDCGPRGGYFDLRKLSSHQAYRVIFTNGTVTTKAQYTAFKGAKLYYGNTTSASAAPAYVAPEGTGAYLPVWFYSDVSYKTPGFWQMSWMGDHGLSTDTKYSPAASMTRMAFAVYMYKLAGSPKVTLLVKSPFTDVKAGATGYTAMVWMYQKKYWTASTFSPSAPLTRATEAVWLYRLAGSPAVTLPSKSPYTDVTKGTTVTYKAIVWAKSKKVMGAASGTSFKSTATVTRAAGAVALYNYWWYVG